MKIVIVATLSLLAGCLAGPNAMTEPGACADPAGFFLGLWHGIVFFISFIASLFTDVSVYEVCNTGGWYDFGYFLGLSSGVGGVASARRRKR